MLLVVLCKCLRQLVVRGSDQLESLSFFGHCAHFTSHDLCNLLYYYSVTFVCIVISIATFWNSAKNEKSDNNSTLVFTLMCTLFDFCCFADFLLQL